MAVKAFKCLTILSRLYRDWSKCGAQGPLGEHRLEGFVEVLIPTGMCRVGAIGNTNAEEIEETPYV